MKVTKVKFFRAESQYELQQAVNEFICYRNIINISYSTYDRGYALGHCCCVIYREE